MAIAPGPRPRAWPAGRAAAAGRARPRAQSVDERFTVCLACHGADGQSRIPETPSLGGQPSFFVVAQLFLFREGRRDNAAMVAAAKGLTNERPDRAFAERVTKLPPPPPPGGPAGSRPLRAGPDPDPAAPLRGLPQPRLLGPRADAAAGQPARGLPAQVHARVQERGPAGLRRRDGAGAGRAQRPGSDRPRPLSRAPEADSRRSRFGGAAGARPRRARATSACRARAPRGRRARRAPR